MPAGHAKFRPPIAARSLSVVTCRDGELCGRSYGDAQAVVVIEALPEPDNRVQLKMTPEIQFGQERPRCISTQGVLRMEVGRDRRAFDELAMSADLASGDMVVLGCLDSRPGSLGDQFFTRDNEGHHEQKLLVIRLSQTQHDDLFDPAGVLPVDEPRSGSPQ